MTAEKAPNRDDGCIECGNQPAVADGLCSDCWDYYENWGIEA